MKFSKPDLQSHIPLYRQIANDIRQKITSNEIRPGDKLPCEEELCKTLEVSVLTLRNALAILSKEGYILRRQNHGTVVVSASPDNKIDLKKRNEIGFVLCPAKVSKEQKNPYANTRVHGIVTGIEEKLRERKLHMIYTMADHESNFSLDGKEKDLAGMIITGEITSRTIKSAQKTGLPFVLVGDPISKPADCPSGKIHVISDDDRQIVYAAVKYLVKLGHRDIAYINSHLDKYEWHAHQLEGYKQALKEANISLNRDLLMETGKHVSEEAYSVVKQFMKKAVPFTALVGISNDLCLGAARAIREENKRIPEDISMITCDGATDFTTTGIDSIEPGRAAVKVLLELIENPGANNVRVTIPSCLVERNSCRKINAPDFAVRLKNFVPAAATAGAGK